MFTAVVRGLPRIIMLAALGIINLLVAHLPELTGLAGGPLPILCPLAYAVGLGCLMLAAGDLVMRLLQPQLDPQALALAETTPAALAYVGHCMLRAAILIIMVGALRIGNAAELPPAAAALLPVLKTEQMAYWPNVPQASALGAQVEQETCSSLRSRSCWNPRAQLRTEREQGIGLGQLTRTFGRDGGVRMDALSDLVRAHPIELAGLSWEHPGDPRLQLRALVLKDRDGFVRIFRAGSPVDQLAMAMAAYNGGAGGLASDRRVCAATRGCDPGRWFGNVERTSLKAKAAIAGYGKSFFEINREYVRNVMQVRRPRYLTLDT